MFTIFIDLHLIASPVEVINPLRIYINSCLNFSKNPLILIKLLHKPLDSYIYMEELSYVVLFINLDIYFLCTAPRLHTNLFISTYDT
jgi:hypothetical protein